MEHQTLHIMFLVLLIYKMHYNRLDLQHNFVLHYMAFVHIQCPPFYHILLVTSIYQLLLSYYHFQPHSTSSSSAHIHRSAVFLSLKVYLPRPLSSYALHISLNRSVPRVRSDPHTLPDYYDSMHTDSVHPHNRYLH